MASNELYSGEGAFKERVVVITSPLPLHNKVGDILLKKLLTVMSGTLDRISLISGNLSNDVKCNSFIDIWANIDYDTRNDDTLTKAVKYGMFQLKYSLSLFKNRHKFDTTLFWIASGLLLPVITSKLLRKRTVVMATGNISVSNPYLKLFERVNYSLGDIIGVESRSVIPHMRLQKYCHKIEVLHLFVDPSFMIQKPINERENVVAFISRLSKEKGIVEFLDAIDIILRENQNIKIIIGSSGPLKPLVEERVKKYDTRVCFMEWIPSNEFVSVLNSIKLLVLPSYTEGLPNIVLEAMACGTPVLATPVGGIPDVINDGVTGFLLDDNSAECIAGAIAHVLASENLYKISLNARCVVASKYSLTAAVKDSRTAMRWPDVGE